MPKRTDISKLKPLAPETVAKVIVPKCPQMLLSTPGSQTVFIWWRNFISIM